MIWYFAGFGVGIAATCRVPKRPHTNTIDAHKTDALVFAIAGRVKAGAALAPSPEAAPVRRPQHEIARADLRRHYLFGVYLSAIGSGASPLRQRFAAGVSGSVS
jgi:hypothetical protein